MQRFRLAMITAIGLVALVAIGAMASAGSTKTQAEEGAALLQMPDFPPTPTISSAPAPQRLRGGTTLFSDSFDTASALKSWQIVDVQQPLPGEESVWRIEGGRLLQDRTARAYNPDFRDTMAVTGDSSWTDYTVSAQVYDAANATVGLVARRQGNSFYRFRWFADGVSGDRKLAIEKVVDGTVTELARASAPGYQHYRWYTIGLSVSGSQITALVDGSPVLQASDTALASGQAGVTTVAFGAVSFDDVQIVTP
jgi:hypothetical protein